MENSSVLKGLVYGGFASMLADVITLPIDTTKTRLQLSGSGSIKYNGAVDCIRKTVAAEGVTALWKGLEPALWRQATYGSMRYGFYNPIKNLIQPGVEKKDMPLWAKIAAGGGSGALSSAMANPTDLVKVRMQGSGSGAGGGHQYKWFLGALQSIIKTDGVGGLYKGVGPTVARASVLAAAELASYDQIKQEFLQRELLNEGLGLHATVAMMAGFIGAFACNPFDVAKSRVMNQPAVAAGEAPMFTGMVDCFTKTVANEGIGALWNGFIPAWARVGPRVVIIFITMEQLKSRFG